MGKMKFKDGIVLLHIHDAYLVVSDKEARKTTPYIREINDTPGLGLKAKDAKFKDQYIGTNVDTLTVTKLGASAENEIDAISGATVTSNAVTNAVNTAFYYLHNCMN